MNNLSMEIISILLMALMGGIGYYLKKISDDIKTITKKIETLDNKFHALAIDVADIKPKVNALWEHFLNTKSHDI